jgi:response regulator NasT
MLHAASCDSITVLHSGGETRRLLLERDFDLVIINSPLPDETGESLSRHVASTDFAQAILVVKSEYFEEMSAATEEAGVLVVAKPVSRTVFWSALKLAKSAQGRLRRMKAENRKLKQKIEDIRIVDRAKCALISYLKMSENEAHKFIEKQAMDTRASKRAVAEGILLTYDC